MKFKFWMICAVFILASSGVRAETQLLNVLGQNEVNTQEETLEPAADKTRMQTLVEWYNQGTPLSIAQFRGYYSGRCFQDARQDTAENSFLGYAQLSEGEDPGPGFPSGQEKIFSIVAQNRSADYFDNESIFEENKKDMKQILANNWNNISFATENSTLSWSYDWEANGNMDEKHEYVAYNTYLVSRWTALLQQKYAGKMRNPGDILGMCYYFKKMGN